jgi:zinc-dependent metalloproteinase lipoprotein
MKYYIYSILAIFCLALTSCKSDEDETSSQTTDLDDDNTTEKINDSYVYQLPVIFHVLYSDKNDDTQYISATQIQKIVANVNDIYKGNVYGESENINLKFILATNDENGNKLSTPGVEYVKWDGEYPIDVSKFMSDNTGANVKYIWDPNEYINVMMYNFKTSSDAQSTVLGVSHMPYTVKGDSALAGLDTVTVSTIRKSQLKFAYCSSINSLYANKESSRYYDQYKGKNGYNYDSRDINVTVAHELGHYLGLHHLFTENVDNPGEYADTCMDTDYCKDTPSYNRVEYEDYLTYYMKTHTDTNTISMNDLLKRTNCDGDSFLSANIMDYMISLGYKISANQKRRIRHVLYNSPLIPGPKVTSTSSRATGSEGKLDLPIRYVK